MGERTQRWEQQRARLREIPNGQCQTEAGEIKNYTKIFKPTVEKDFLKA